MSTKYWLYLFLGLSSLAIIQNYKQVDLPTPEKITRPITDARPVGGTPYHKLLKLAITNRGGTVKLL